MSLQRNQPNKPEASITREQLKQEAARLRNQQKNSCTSPEEIPPETEQNPPHTLEQIAEMSRKLAYLSAENVREAQKDERVSLLIAAVMEMCRILTEFSQNISEEMGKISENEMKNLNIQELYAESVQKSTGNIARNIYLQFEREQKQAFDEIRKYLSDTNDEMEKEIYSCIKEIKKATKYAVYSAERLRKLKKINDLFYFSVLILAVLDFLLHLHLNLIL